MLVWCGFWCDVGKNRVDVVCRLLVLVDCSFWGICFFVLCGVLLVCCIKLCGMWFIMILLFVCYFGVEGCCLFYVLYMNCLVKLLLFGNIVFDVSVISKKWVFE